MTALATPPAPLRPAAAPGPQPYRWTLETYRKLAETGMLDGTRTILLHGVLYEMPNPKPPHDIALNLMQEYLRAVVPAGHHVRNQQSFIVGTDNDPGPDLAAVPGSIRDYTVRAPTTALMVVEVADSSLFSDTTTKAELYATAGVPDYWVIDVAGRRVVVFRDPHPIPDGGAAYRTKVEFAETDAVAPLAAPTAAVKVADLLP